MSRVVICDRCGKTIEGVRIGSISWEWLVGPKEEIPMPNPFEHWDFCEDCMNNIRMVIEHKIEAEPVPDPEEQQPDSEPKKRKRNPGGKMGAPKKIDRGKVFALRKAGWTAAKIADEMKCSLGTVKRILQEEAPYEQDERVFID